MYSTVLHSSVTEEIRPGNTTEYTATKSGMHEPASGMLMSWLGDRHTPGSPTHDYKDDQGKRIKVKYKLSNSFLALYTLK